MSNKVISVDINDVFVEDQKHRMKLDIENLAQSILSTGQINPITVTKVKNEYRVIAGRRRYAALRYIQEELKPNEKIKALILVTDLSELQQELIKIDENIMRQQLKGAEFDEAIFRRKQIYEDLHPETKKAVSGAHAKHSKVTGKKKPLSFSRDASRKLGVTKKTVERAVARASKASEKVKLARAKGELSPTKVDLLVSLPVHEQDLLLPFLKGKDVSEIRSVIEASKKRGAKSVSLDLQELIEEDKRLKPLIRDVKSLTGKISEALKSKLILEGGSKHDSLRAVDELAKVAIRFADLQRAGLGYVRAISVREGQGRKVIRGRL